LKDSKHPFLMDTLVASSKDSKQPTTPLTALAETIEETSAVGRNYPNYDALVVIEKQEPLHDTAMSTPTKIFQDDEKNGTPPSLCDCPICYEEIKSISLFKTQCGHAFHLTCLSTWRSHHNKSCPICRSSLPHGAGLTPVGHSSPVIFSQEHIQVENSRRIISNAQRVRDVMRQRVVNGGLTIEVRV
jgi:hypothetical protein